MMSSTVNTEANLLTGRRKQWAWKQQSFSVASDQTARGLLLGGRGVRGEDFEVSWSLALQFTGGQVPKPF